ncbi:hypothetical protein [Ammoniphilus sp. 3BR4]|uniref:hypothetical protein n=1 Tax=Ammoniphilus sp. 3BR4 TaxID=3158265 RepID=UPI0034665543
MLKLFRSPVGIALTIAGVILAISPEARQATRRVAVKGTSFILGLVDDIKDSSSRMIAEEYSNEEKVQAERNAMPHESLHFDEYALYEDPRELPKSRIPLMP